MLKESLDLHRKGLLAEAEQGYRSCLASHPDDVDALHLLGVLRHQLGDNAEAERLLDEARKRAPDNGSIEASLATVHFSNGDHAAALRGYEHALALDPNLAAAHSGIGQIALLRGDRSDAEQHFRVALRASEDAQALAGLGALELERGAVDDALRYLGRAADLAPNDAMTQFLLGRAFAIRGTDAFAERAFENALRLRPDLHQAHHMLGALLMRNKRFPEAETHFRALLAVPPLAALGHVGLGDVARNDNRAEEAVTSYRSALTLAPQQPRVVRALASTLATLGRLDEAIAAYDACLAMTPDDAEVLSARAELLAAVGRGEQALAEWRSALERAPGDLRARTRLAQAEERLGELEASRTEAETVLATQPDNIDMLMILVRAALRSGEHAAARELLERIGRMALSTGQASAYANHLGRLHDATGEWTDAARSFAEAQRVLPVLMPPLGDPHAEFLAVLDEPVGEPWPQAPVLLLGTPGSNVELVAALLRDQPSLTVLSDRIGLVMRDDDFSQPRFAHYAGPLDDDARAALRARYQEALQRARVSSERLVVDWLPRWDAHLLALIRRAMPGTRLVIVEREPRDALLNWLAFGWMPGFACAEPTSSAQWLARAGKHLQFGAELDEPSRLVVSADALLADPAGSEAGRALARFLGLDALQDGQWLARASHGPGGLPVRFPAGHWKNYADALAGAFACLE